MKPLKSHSIVFSVKQAFGGIGSLLLICTAIFTGTVNGVEPESNTAKEDWTQIQAGTFVWLARLDLLPPEGYVIQLGSFKVKEHLTDYVLGKNLEDINLFGIQISKGEGVRHLLLYGPFINREHAKKIEEKINRKHNVKTWVRTLTSLNSQ